MSGWSARCGQCGFHADSQRIRSLPSRSSTCKTWGIWNAVRTVLAVVTAAWLLDPSVAQASDTASGEHLFRRRCGSCYQIAATRNGVGPHL
jgi:mono/diheme cytochrome c family protein